ncbi:MAG: NUDIX domain-containing protein [Lentisphaerae bacterium]|nr:NUDIX domain-containing protein [Lentisphaerota bacterium]
MKKQQVETIVRGVVCACGYVLLCRTEGAANTYLPGGHIDFGESARAALAREMMEEAGLDSEPGRFLGCVEHTFVQKGERKSEINILFTLDMPGAEPPEPPRPLEDRLGFLWARPDELDELALEPAPLRGLLRALLRGESPAVVWASTYGGAA